MNSELHNLQKSCVGIYEHTLKKTLEINFMYVGNKEIAYLTHAT